MRINKHQDRHVGRQEDRWTERQMRTQEEDARVDKTTDSYEVEKEDKQ